MFPNPDEEPMLKLSLYLHFDEYLMVKVRVLEGVRSAAVVHCMCMSDMSTSIIVFELIM